MRKKIIWLSLAVLMIFSIAVFTEESSDEKANDTVAPVESSPVDEKELLSKEYRIEYVAPKDLSKNHYEISIYSHNPTQLKDEIDGSASDDKKKTKKEITKKFYRIEIGEVKTDIKKDSAQLDEDNENLITMKLIAYYKLKPGKNLVKLYVTEHTLVETKDGEEEETEKHAMVERLLTSRYFIFPLLNDQPSQQPLIKKVTPEGGTSGDTFTITGKNFGKDIDGVEILFFDTSLSGGKELIETTSIKPFYFTTETKGDSEIRFSIPLGMDLMEGNPIKNSVLIQVVVNGRPSNYQSLTVIAPNWRLYTAILSIIIVILFMGSIALLVRKANVRTIIELILIDKATNTYSLSKFQAFTWTIVLIGSYFYLGVAQGLLLRNGVIPDFKTSLIVLMGISYGGLITANGLQAKKPKNEIRDKKPEWSNLISVGGSIDLSRLQLFGFTIVGILLYIYNLYTSNPLAGLPDIPPTLLSLMGVSQTGYLGAKAMGDKVSVNFLSPKVVPIGKETTITLVGSGFVQNSKILVEGVDQPISAEFQNAGSISFRLPAQTEAKVLSLVIVPGSGSSTEVSDAIEIKDAADMQSDSVQSDSSEKPKKEKKSKSTETKVEEEISEPVQEDDTVVTEPVEEIILEEDSKSKK